MKGKGNCCLHLILFIFLVFSVVSVVAVPNITVTAVVVEFTLPVINLEAPDDNTTNTTTNTLGFTYNTSDASSLDNCTLIINDEINITSTTMVKDTAGQTLTTNLPSGDYTWSVNCTDNSNNMGSSETRNISISYIPPDTTPSGGGGGGGGESTLESPEVPPIVPPEEPPATEEGISSPPPPAIKTQPEIQTPKTPAQPHRIREWIYKEYKPLCLAISIIAIILLSIKFYQTRANKKNPEKKIS